MILNPSDILEIKLDGDVTTNQLSYYISYSRNGIVASKHGLTYHESIIEMLPRASVLTEVLSILIYNLDTVAAVVTLQLNTASKRTILIKKTLQPGESLQYDGDSFDVSTTSSGGGACSVIVNNFLGTSTAIKQSYVTGEDIDAGQAVFIDSDELLYIMDISNSAHFGKCIGIAEETIATGLSCSIVISGYCMVATSGWAAGDSYYIDATGFLTDTPPVMGWSQQVANGIGTDIVSVDLTTGIELI